MRPYAPPPGSIPTLDVPDLRAIGTAHLVGIGGAGMSGIARLLLARGVQVTGSDLKDSSALDALRALGADVHVGHAVEHVGDVDAVVISTAIPSDNPEVVEGRRRGIAVLARAQVLAALMAERRAIAVAGTHGKTSTTSMLAAALERAGLDPTYLVGGDLNESGSNARSGSGDLFVAEADESDGSFLLLSPDVAVVTNVEEDHLDFYRDRAEIESAFVAFCRRAGAVIACADDDGAVRVARESGASVTWYGEAEAADVRVDRIEVTPEGGRCRIGVRLDGDRWTGDVSVGIPGRQHLLNAAAALAAAAWASAPLDRAAEALRGFRGVHRRWDRRGAARGAEFVDDYAHHPTEIAATLAAARVNGRRVIAVFQPHRYSRTRALWREIGESLRQADLSVVTDVYGAGEEPVPGITGKLVVQALAEAAPGKRVVYLPHRKDLAPFLVREVRGGDLVLTLGAGDITLVADEALTLLRQEEERSG